MPTQTEQIDALITATTDLKQTFETKRDDINAVTEANTNGANQAIADLTNARAAFDADAQTIADRKTQADTDAAAIASANTAAQAGLASIQAGRAGELLPPNLIPDPYLRNYSEVDGKKIPHSGFRPGPGSIAQTELLHPYWYGASGVMPHSSYIANVDDGTWPVTTDIQHATPTSPLHWTAINKAAIKRDGLADVWSGARPQGHSLKVTVDPFAAGTHNQLHLGVDQNINAIATGALFRAWVLVISGEISIGDHEGYAGNFRPNTSHSIQHLTAEWVWKFVEFEIGGYYAGQSFFNLFSIGAKPETGATYLIVAPYLAALRGTESINGTWGVAS